MTIAASASGRRLLVALPALNEEPTIARVIAAIPRRFDGVAAVDVLVVDDGSTDRTASLARESGATVVSHGRNRGLGVAFQTMLQYARNHGYDLLVTIDADGQFDPQAIGALIAPILGGEADFVTASRFKDPALVPVMPPIKLWGNRQVSRLVSLLCGQKFYDVSCGMRAYGRPALTRLTLLGRFTYTHEVILAFSFMGLVIQEVPVKVAGQREFGKSRIANSILNYALQASSIIFRCYRDYHPLQFFSTISALLGAGGALLGGGLMVRYFATGMFTPYKWVGFASAFLLTFALVTLLFGLLADMLRRHRLYLEELIEQKRAEKFGQHRSGGETPASDTAEGRKEGGGRCG